MFKVGDTVRIKPDQEKFYFGGHVRDAKKIHWEVVEIPTKYIRDWFRVRIKALENSGNIFKGERYSMLHRELEPVYEINEEDIWE